MLRNWLSSITYECRRLPISRAMLPRVSGAVTLSLPPSPQLRVDYVSLPERKRERARMREIKVGTRAANLSAGESRCINTPVDVDISLSHYKNYYDVRVKKILILSTDSRFNSS